MKNKINKNNFFITEPSALLKFADKREKVLLAHNSKTHILPFVKTRNPSQ